MATYDPTRIDTQEITKFAQIAARRYKRKCWWVDQEDLQQYALVAVLEAAQHYDPDTGVPFNNYAWKAIINKLHRAVLRASAPVSASDKTVVNLKGLYREMIYEDLLDPAPLVDELLGALYRQKRLRAAVEDVAQTDADHILARSVLLYDEKPRAVADEHRVPVTKVYAAVQRCKTRIAESYECWLLWNEEV